MKIVTSNGVVFHCNLYKVSVQRDGKIDKICLAYSLCEFIDVALHITPR